MRMRVYASLAQDPGGARRGMWTKSAYKGATTRGASVNLQAH